MGYYKIKLDGSSKGNPTHVSSIVIRNNDGVWITGCVRGLGVTSNFVIELCGLRDGLLLAKNRSLLRALIEIDSMAVYYALTKDKLDTSISVYRLIAYCRSLLNLLGKPPIKHVYREANGVADWMVKNVDAFCNELNVYEQTPGSLLPLLPFDSMGCT